MSDSTEVTAAVHDVWDFLYRPESAVVLFPNVEYSVRIDGTGPGVGEMHVAISRTPGTVERVLTGVVVERFEPPTFAQYRSLNQRPHSTYTLDLRGAGGDTTAITFTATTEFITRARIDLVSAFEQSQAESLRLQLAGTRQHFA